MGAERPRACPDPTPRCTVLARPQPRPASASDLAGLPLPSLRLFKLKKRYRNVLDTMFELLPRMAR